MTHIDMNDDDDERVFVSAEVNEQALRMDCLQIAASLFSKDMHAMDVLATAEAFVAFVKGRVN